MAVCAKDGCEKEFEPSSKRHKFCCRKCYKSVDNRVQTVRRQELQGRPIIERTEGKCGSCGGVLVITRQDAKFCTKPECQLARHKHYYDTHKKEANRYYLEVKRPQLLDKGLLKGNRLRQHS